ncbi:MAG: hypothetical protein IJY57_00970 [Clostridia bacterium]|nr:hypothetical protein [Clostridia bacterium]
MVEYSYNRAEVKKIAWQYAFPFTSSLIAIGIVYSAYAIMKLIPAYIYADYVLVKESWLELIGPALFFVATLITYIVFFKKFSIWFDEMKIDGEQKATIEKEGETFIIRKEGSDEGIKFSGQLIKKETSTKNYTFLTLVGGLLIILPIKEEIIKLLHS